MSDYKEVHAPDMDTACTRIAPDMHSTCTEIMHVCTILGAVGNVGAVPTRRPQPHFRSQTLSSLGSFTGTITHPPSCSPEKPVRYLEDV